MVSQVDRLSTIKYQTGAVILVTVTLLLILITLVTLYTSKIQSFEHKIMLNSQNQTLAFMAAEAGLIKGLAQLQQDKSWFQSSINGKIAGQYPFSVSATSQLVNRNGTKFNVFEFASIGGSADELASATIKQQALVYSLLFNIPSAPLVVKGGLSNQMSFELVANPHGGGKDVPLSLWSNENVDLMAVNGYTCGLQEFNDGQCLGRSYSSSSSDTGDVLINDLQFPDDVFAYLFNLPSSHFSTLRSDADLRVNACSELGDDTSGFVWVEGNCSIRANVTIGRQSDPVLLLINDGNLKLNTDSYLFGLIIMFKQPSTVRTYDISMATSSAIHGALVSNQRLGNLAGNIRVIYNESLLQEIVDLPQFKRVANVPGSWQDF